MQVDLRGLSRLVRSQHAHDVLDRMPRRDHGGCKEEGERRDERLPQRLHHGGCAEGRRRGEARRGEATAAARGKTALGKRQLREGRGGGGASGGGGGGACSAVKKRTMAGEAMAAPPDACAWFWI